MISTEQRDLAAAMLSEFENALGTHNSAVGLAQNETLASINMILHQGETQARHDLLFGEATAQLEDVEAKAVASLTAIYSDSARRLDQARQTDAYKAAETRRQGLDAGGIRLAEAAIHILRTALSTT